MLRVDLALRSFKEEQGSYPDRLDQLKTSEGAVMPVDPFTGQLFVYRKKYKRGLFRKTEVGFDLYSPGPKGIDRGGIFGSWPQVMEADADFCLDWADYQQDN
jgi:hypothetical protein